MADEKNEQDEPGLSAAPQPGTGIALWMPIGLAMGISLGQLADNLAMGIGLGMGVGVAIGAAFEAANKKRREGASGADA